MKSFHICAYVFKADIVCCDCIATWAESGLKEFGYTAEEINEIASLGPGYDSGVYGWRSESLLRSFADTLEIDLEDEYSYDTDDFPKVVFADQVEDREYCGTCHEVIL